MAHESTQSAWYSRLAKLLVEPHPSIKDPSDRRLVMLLAVYNLLSLPTGPVIRVIRPDLPESFTGFIVGLCFAFYVLSRSAYAFSVLEVQMFSAIGIPIFLCAVSPSRQGVHFIFLFPVLLSTLLHSLRTLSICAGISYASFIIVTHIVPPTEPTIRGSSMLILFLLMSVIIITKYHIKSEEQERERLKEQDRRKYLTLVDSTFDGIATITHGLFNYVSPGFAQVFSIIPSETYGQSASAFFQSTLKTEEPLDTQLRLFSALNSKGQMRFVQMIAKQVSDDETVIAVRDVTVEQDDNLRRLLLERITSTGMIASSVAHEMNTPLMIAQNQIERSINAVSSFDENTANRLTSATAALDQIESILRDLRWFVDSGSKQHTTTPKTAIENAIRLAHHRIQHRTTLSVNVDNLPPLAIPEGKLSQIIINLIFNAAKARREDQEMIEIEVKAEVLDSEVKLTVADNGIGIPKHLHQRIFSPFFTTNASEGMGLGLALCQSIIHNAKGRMELSSEPQHGTRFTLYIPVYESNQAQHTQGPLSVAESKPARRRQPDKNLRILIIESHPHALNMMGEILHTQSVYLHRDAHTALDTHDLTALDLILCDARLPAG
ncbi:MAG: ATP-binding protein, partial [Bradymonadia bacterium]